MSGFCTSLEEMARVSSCYYWDYMCYTRAGKCIVRSRPVRWASIPSLNPIATTKREIHKPTTLAAYLRVPRHLHRAAVERHPQVLAKETVRKESLKKEIITKRLHHSRRGRGALQRHPRRANRRQRHAVILKRETMGDPTATTSHCRNVVIRKRE